jgi:hypothetical protein
MLGVGSKNLGNTTGDIRFFGDADNHYS